MLCPSCKNFRPTNSAPCPFCQAPSPLGNNQATFNGNAWDEQQQPFATSGTWGQPMAFDDERQVVSGQLAFPTSPWQNTSQAAQQLAFPNAAQQSDNAFWSQTLAPDREADQPGNPPSLLPMPYQGPPASGPQGLMVMPNGFPAFHQGANPLLPALPDADQEPPVYVPPMYTKPRPLISRYRAISGLLSMLIVCGLLCTGAGYYAQTTGKLVFFEKLFGTYSPPPITSSTGSRNLTVPSLQQTVVPNAVIISAATANGTNINLQTGAIANEVNQFNVDETIYLSCNFPSAPGTVSVKWYNGNNLYHTTAQQVADTKNNGTGITVMFRIVYALATEGKAEIYWNNQLQTTLFFVVEPAP